MSPPPQHLPPPGVPVENYYPNTNVFPPPPGAGYSPQPAYNPADYPPNQAHINYDYPPQAAYTPPGQGPYSPMPADPYAPPPGSSRARRADENVSAEPYLNTASSSPSGTAPIVVPDPRDLEEGV